MPEDYAQAYNNQVLAEQSAKEAEPESAAALVHDITKHQTFAADGSKIVYHCDHTTGRVYIVGDRGLLRYSGDNIAQVSQFPPLDDNLIPANGYVKTVSPAGIVSYTDLAGAPYAPSDADVEYIKNDAGVFVKLVQPDATKAEPKQSKKQDNKE